MRRRDREKRPPPRGGRPSRDRGRGGEAVAGRSGGEEAPENLVYGFHPVIEALRQGRTAIDRVLVSRGPRPGGPPEEGPAARAPRPEARIGRIHRMARDAGVPVQFVPPEALERLTSGGRHQGFAAVIAARDYAPLDLVLERASAPVPAGAGPGGLIVLADGIQDPRNLGAIIRTAGAAGAAGVVLPAHGASGLTAAAAKAAAGALESVPVARGGNLVALASDLKERGFWIVGLEPTAEKLWTDADFRQPTALVVGGEEGLRDLLRRRCDILVRLPVALPVESLNASVAVGVVLYELIRQRSGGGGGSG